MDASAIAVSDSDNLLSPEEAATRLKCSAVTLARWRTEGTGPEWHRIGPRRVVYRSNDIERFMQPNQFALVYDGQIVPAPNAPIVMAHGHKAPDHYSSNYPAGCKWLPVVSVDSEPFNVEQHYRLKPSYRVAAAGDRVERLYPIINKSEAV